MVTRYWRPDQWPEWVYTEMGERPPPGQGHPRHRYHCAECEIEGGWLVSQTGCIKAGWAHIFVTHTSEEILDPARALNSIRHVNLYRIAVSRQVTRVLQDQEQGYPALLSDMLMLVWATRQWLRAVKVYPRYVSKERGVRIVGGLGRFNQKIPKVTDLRDILEHFDAYAMGTGRLYHSEPQVTVTHLWEFATGGLQVGDGIVMLSFPGSQKTPLRLDVRKVDAETERLTGLVLKTHGDLFSEWRR